MSALKLGRIPDHTPVKLAIALGPDLYKALQDYAQIYSETYGQDKPVTDLIPAILSAFLETDRAFIRARQARTSDKTR